MVMVADTASGLPPVATLAMQHVANAAHSAGYLITGGVQSRIIPLTQTITALLGLVTL